MRWLHTIIFLFGFIFSVLSSEVDDSEPYLHIMARSSVYNADETKAIFCKGKNLVAPMEWYSPLGKLIKGRSTKNPRVYVETKNEGAETMLPLIMHNIKISDSGNWTCKSGDLTDIIEIIVGEKVIIPDRNVTVEGEEGKSIKFSCEANGYPPPVVVWYKDNFTPIPHDSKKFVIKGDNSLEIKKLNHADVGQYVCKVRQKILSHYTDKTVHLTVQHKPILYNNYTREFYTTKYKTEEVYAILNETKNITCSAIANPLPTYKWYRRANSNYDELITDEEMVFTSEDGTYSLLVLRMRDDSFLGEYKCTANNSKGQESIIYHVSLGTKPNPPDFVNLVAANVTELTFNVTCSTCPMETEGDMAPNPLRLTILGYTFEFVPANEGFPADWEFPFSFDVEIQQPNDTIFTVGPLSNNTEFHARVRARNAAGYSEWFDIVPNPMTISNAINLASTLTLINLAFLFTRWF